MSRLIVKNLPNGIKEERLRKHFGVVGPVTDCSLKYTKDGMFRKFAFIGFKTEVEAKAAVKQFNKTFIDTAKIQIEVARDFGDANKPRAWSKYAKDSSAGQRNMPVRPDSEKEEDEKKSKKKKKKKKDNPVVDELLKDVKDDPKFSEFLEVHQSRSTKPVWTNESGQQEKGEGSGGEQEGEGDEEVEEGELGGVPGGRGSLDEDEDGSDVEMAEKEDEEVELKEEKHKAAIKKGLSDLDYLKSKISKEPEDAEKNTSKLQPNAKGEKAVREFFNPLKIVRMRIPKSASNKPMGFKTEKDLDEALRKNKNFIGGKRVFLKKAESEEMPKSEPEKLRPWELKNQDGDNTEGIAETGRLFVRNLSYSCTEDDLEAEFKKFGPLTEVNLPVDSLTKKVKGFAFITYMMPEHAVKAFTKLDGKVFQGRMLHILPGKEKKEDEEETGGVRMALGETQIVQETRDFLTESGVALDSFSQPNAARSKSVILVKNLPAKTERSEIEQVFSPYGTLGRVLIPPSGITAIVEFFRHVPLYLEWAPMSVFTSPTPEQGTKQEQQAGNQEENKSEDDKSEKTNEQRTEMKPESTNDKTKEKEEDEEDEDDEVGSVLFVKNLNFNTMDEALIQHFSSCKTFKSASIAKKKDLKNPGQQLSMGYGFVEFRSPNGAQEALKTMQHTDLDGHVLEVKISNRTTASSQSSQTSRKKQKEGKQRTTKILVRNIPFEAKKHEIAELFKVFGELKTRAFEALCQSTHLYGRRLVLEWADTEEDIDDIRKRTADHFHETDTSGKKFTKAGLKESLETSLAD
ncbi:RBM19-like protein [Mya arenaria]|uniref:RBM19-like protein n=1 Tax=Mya arenaria TaxID=6604 RepID=A0ABY7DW66_MYAAR|nr:RBM19-like protein [Mya arenaria]